MVREGEGGGAQGTEAGICLQPMETMVDQVFPAACGEDHGGADNHAAAHRWPHTRAGEYFLKELCPWRTCAGAGLPWRTAAHGKTYRGAEEKCEKEGAAELLLITCNPPSALHHWASITWVRHEAEPRKKGEEEVLF